MEPTTLEDRVRDDMRGPGSLDARLARALGSIAEGFEARTCTLHQVVPPVEPGGDTPGGGGNGGRVLSLRAALGLPDEVRDVVGTVPFGKGMAGICAERREPVTTCNLQTDESGVVRPGAKQTGVAGALVVPLFRGGDLAGTLGVGKDRDHDYSPDEQRVLRACGEAILGVIYQQ